MTKARDLMTSAVAAVPPEATVAEVAQVMRDRNIGDVLVMEDGKLRGIVTDRDIAARAVAAGDDPRSALVKDYMTTHVVTGEPNWSLDKVAHVMGKKQIRRLPVVEKGRVVGIVSLGDVALRGRDEPAVAKSLRSISEAPAVQHARISRGGGLFKGLLFTLLAGAVTALVMNQRGGSQEFN